MSFRRSAPALSLALAISAPALAHAEQFIVADETYTHSAKTTSDSHFRVAPRAGSPTNWVSPTNYSNGSVHVALEVKTKPSDAKTRFQICFEGSPGYACTDQSEAYTTPRFVEWTTPFSKFYQGNGGVDWSKPIKKVALILKDDKNVKPAPENVGDATSKKFFPTDLHVEVAVLTAGATYQPPTRGSDAGVLKDAGVRSDAAVDASVGDDEDEVDAGEEPTDPDQRADAAVSGRRDASVRPTGDATVDADDDEEETDVQQEPATASDDSGCALASRDAMGASWLLMLALVLRRRKRS